MAVRFLAAAAALFILSPGIAASGSQAGGEQKPAISRGMSADTIRGLIGDPAEIRILESEGVKAETWIYRRTIGTEITQEAVLTEKLPAFVGPGYGDSNNIDLVTVPAYRLRRTTATQVTALLMVDDTLSFGKQWVERDTAYDY